MGVAVCGVGPILAVGLVGLGHWHLHAHAGWEAQLTTAYGLAAGVAGLSGIAVAGWMVRCVDLQARRIARRAEQILGEEIDTGHGRPGIPPLAGIEGAIDALEAAYWREHARAEDAGRRDLLTGVLNRAGLSRALESLGGQERSISVIHVDLDGVRHINDSRGRAAGDAVLREVARRLEDAGASAVARVGGDGFAVVFERDESPDPRALAQDIVSRLHVPVAWNGGALHVRARAGVAGLDPGWRTAQAMENLDRNARTALRDTRRKGGGSVAVFEPGRCQAELAAADLDAEVADALARSAFEPFIQPQIDLGTGRVTGAEILARWRHPRYGLLSPSVFLSNLCEPALGAAIDFQVREKALAWMGAAPQARPETISINLTASHLHDPDGADTLSEEIRAAGLSPEQVVFEVHENVVLDAAGTIEATLKTLSGRGHRLELDDFGTSGASLQNLLRLPIDMLKIDRSFITGIEGDLERQAVVEAVVGLATALDVCVLAEGVETMSEVEALRELRCTRVQGYLVARPMPLAVYPSWISAAGNRGRVLPQGG